MSGRLFAQIVALLLIAGAFIWLIMRDIDNRRQANAENFIEQATRPAPAPTLDSEAAAQAIEEQAAALENR